MRIGSLAQRGEHAPYDKNADHAPRSAGLHSPINPQQVTARKGAWAFATWPRSAVA